MKWISLEATEVSLESIICGTLKRYFVGITCAYLFDV